MTAPEVVNLSLRQLRMLPVTNISSKFRFSESDYENHFIWKIKPYLDLQRQSHKNSGTIEVNIRDMGEIDQC